MTKANSYGQFCSVARAAEIVASRWTLVILRELLAGSTKFNELRYGVPQMSPSLLSKRLSELHEAGIVDKKSALKGRGYEYFLSDSGKELGPIIMTLGVWGQKFVLAEFEKHELDPTLLMWDIQRRIETSIFPAQGRFVAEFFLKGAPVKRRNWWLIIVNQKVELCVQHPGFEIDISVEADLRTLTNVWMGVCSVASAKKQEGLKLKGNSKYIKSFEKWFLLSPFAEHYPRT